jgi:hypothetical protein
LPGHRFEHKRSIASILVILTIVPALTAKRIESVHLRVLSKAIPCKTTAADIGRS